jgi:hypothetical protein
VLENPFFHCLQQSGHEHNGKTERDAGQQTKQGPV